MTAAKPGDRVRITFEGRYERADRGFVVVVNHGRDARDGKQLVSVPYTQGAVTVEVLASPVYVNHDTTEYRPGDVVRDNSGAVWLRGVDPDRRTVWTPVFGMDSTGPLNGPLTLLVRDGQVIA